MRRTAITFFGCGEVPFASGTWGSAGAMVVAAAWYLATRAAFDAPRDHWWLHGGLLVGTLAACVLSILWGPWAVEFFANHHNTRKPGDPGAFVLDEVAGQWLSLLLLPMATPQHALIIATVQFFVFRAADIVKPPPGRMLEKLPHGWGILFDDLSSAVYANLFGQLLFRWWLGWS